MSSVQDDAAAADHGVDGGASAQTPPSEGGDLEFDEAWTAGGAQSDARRDRGDRDPNPSFEDPSER
jgi:hypothetical protein